MWNLGADPVPQFSPPSRLKLFRNQKSWISWLLSMLIHSTDSSRPAWSPALRRNVLSVRMHVIRPAMALWSRLDERISSPFAQGVQVGDGALIVEPRPIRQRNQWFGFKCHRNTSDMPLCGVVI
jgi:hypothetical protein